jgi:hypothetical protein
MDAREEIGRWLALLVQLSSDAESDQIDDDIKMLTGVTQQLSSELAKRNIDRPPPSGPCCLLVHNCLLRHGWP